MEAEGLTIQNAEIAIASKDLSELIAGTLTIRDSRVGFSVYQKKPEFGPGTVIGRQVTMNNVDQPFLLESGSRVEINGKPIIAELTDVEAMLYGVEYGKSSR